MDTIRNVVSPMLVANGWFWLCLWGLALTWLWWCAEQAKLQTTAQTATSVSIWCWRGIAGLSILGIALFYLFPVGEDVAWVLILIIAIIALMTWFVRRKSTKPLPAAILTVWPGVIVTFVLGLLIQLFYFLPTMDETRTAGLPEPYTVDTPQGQAAPTIQQLATQLAQAEACESKENTTACYSDLSVDEIAQAIVAFNLGGNGVFQGKSLSSTVDNGTKVQLPPRAIVSTTYLIDSDDSLEKIAACQTETEIPNCQVTTASALIRDNAKKGLLNWESPKIVAGQRILRRPGAATTATISLFGLGSFQANVAAFGLIAGLMACLLVLIITTALRPKQTNGNKANVVTHLFTSAKGGGHLSVSKFQMWLWTLTLIFAYVSVSLIRIVAGKQEPIAEVPSSLIILMGLSVGTYSLARVFAIQNTDVDYGQLENKSEQAVRVQSLVEGSDGRSDITRFQLLAFTVIGVAFFAFRLVTTIRHTPFADLAIPDVDTVIMALILTSQAAYLAKKTIEKAGPSLDKMFIFSKTKHILIKGHNLGGASDTTDISVKFDGGVDHKLTLMPDTTTHKLLVCTTSDATIFDVTQPKPTKGDLSLRIKGVEHTLSLTDIERFEDDPVSIETIDPPNVQPQAGQMLTLKGRFMKGEPLTISLLPPNGAASGADGAEKPATAIPDIPVLSEDEVKVPLDLSNFKAGQWQVEVKQLGLDMLKETKSFCIGDQPPPTITNIAPRELDAGQTIDFTLTGNNLGDDMPEAIRLSPTGAADSNPLTLTGTQLLQKQNGNVVAKVAVPADAQLGGWYVWLKTKDGRESEWVSDKITVKRPAPTIISVTRKNEKITIEATAVIQNQLRVKVTDTDNKPEFFVQDALAISIADQQKFSIVVTFASKAVAAKAQTVALSNDGQTWCEPRTVS